MAAHRLIVGVPAEVEVGAVPVKQCAYLLPEERRVEEVTPPEEERRMPEDEDPLRPGGGSEGLAQKLPLFRIPAGIVEQNEPAPAAVEGAVCPSGPRQPAVMGSGSPEKSRSRLAQHLQRHALLARVIATAFDQIAGGNEQFTPFGGDHRPEPLQILGHSGIPAVIRFDSKRIGDAGVTPRRQTEMGVADHGKTKRHEVPPSIPVSYTIPALRRKCKTSPESFRQISRIQHDFDISTSAFAPVRRRCYISCNRRN